MVHYVIIFDSKLKYQKYDITYNNRQMRQCFCTDECSPYIELYLNILLHPRENT